MCVSRYDAQSDENMYYTFQYGCQKKEVDYGVVKWVEHTMRWFGHDKNEDEERADKDKTEGEGDRGRPPLKWINRVDKY